MIKRYKVLIISMLIVIASVCMITAGCKFSLSLEDVLEKYELDTQVTYFLNKGQFEDKSQKKEMYYKAGAKPFNIGVDSLLSGDASVGIMHGYEFTGWYVAQLGPNGRPLYADGTEYDGANYDTERGGILFSNELFDFSKPLEKDDHYYVCAAWSELLRLRIKLVCEDFESMTVGETTYKTGDEVASFVLASDQPEPNKNYLVPGLDINEYTAVEFYTDIECKNRFTDWPVKSRFEGEDEILYVKYIKGYWNIISDADGVGTLFSSSGASANHYFISDVDCSELGVVAKFNRFSGVIRGNGYKVSNLNVVATGGYLANGAKASIFGDIQARAVMKDITFENIKVKFDVRDNADPYIYFVASSIADGATIENVVIGGELAINLNDGSRVTSTTQTHWLYGHVVNDRDYTGGITIVDGTSCVITSLDGTTQTFIYNKNSEDNN